jgi:hypothetical protein
MTRLTLALAMSILGNEWQEWQANNFLRDRAQKTIRADLRSKSTTGSGTTHCAWVHDDGMCFLEQIAARSGQHNKQETQNDNQSRIQGQSSINMTAYNTMQAKMASRRRNCTQSVILVH